MKSGLADFLNVIRNSILRKLAIPPILPLLNPPRRHFLRIHSPLYSTLSNSRSSLRGYPSQTSTLPSLSPSNHLSLSLQGYPYITSTLPSLSPSNHLSLSLQGYPYITPTLPSLSQSNHLPDPRSWPTCLLRRRPHRNVVFDWNKQEIMKIRTLSRSKREHTRERPQDIQRVYRNVSNSTLHPFTREREYVRARNAVKLDKMFAKPFIGALDGHADGVYAMATSSTSLVGLITGTFFFFFFFFLRVYVSFMYLSSNGIMYLVSVVSPRRFVLLEADSGRSPCITFGFFSSSSFSHPRTPRRSQSTQELETVKYAYGTWHIDARCGAFGRTEESSKV